MTLAVAALAGLIVGGVIVGWLIEKACEAVIRRHMW